jgi:hypothetical protein
MTKIAKPVLILIKMNKLIIMKVRKEKGLRSRTVNKKRFKIKLKFRIKNN